MSEKTELLEAELAAAKLEDAFLEAKAAYEAGDLSYEDYREVKVEFHDARSGHRELRQAVQEAKLAEQAALEAESGDAIVDVQTISATGDLGEVL